MDSCPGLPLRLCSWQDMSNIYSALHESSRLLSELQTSCSLEVLKRDSDLVWTSQRQQHSQTENPAGIKSKVLFLYLESANYSKVNASLRSASERLGDTTHALKVVLSIATVFTDAQILSQ